jgi:hypothetical protein
MRGHGKFLLRDPVPESALIRYGFGHVTGEIFPTRSKSNDHATEKFTVGGAESRG